MDRSGGGDEQRTIDALRQGPACVWHRGTHTLFAMSSRWMTAGFSDAMPAGLSLAFGLGVHAAVPPEQFDRQLATSLIGPMNVTRARP
jgi:hypothetical protein